MASPREIRAFSRDHQVARALRLRLAMKTSLRLLFVLSGALVSGAAALACGASDTSSALSGGGTPGNDNYARSDAGAAPPAWAGDPDPATVGKLVENDWVETATEPTSTFGIDVDTGSYTLARQALRSNTLPQVDSVRVEEFINYFRYAYPGPQDDKPFAIHLDGAPSRFGDGHHLLRVAMQGKVVLPENRKPANLVFLVDVSGSMGAANKLPLVQYTLRRLLEKLGPKDSLALVTYASNERVVLAPTPVTDKAKILQGIDALSAGGSTNGEGGIRKAYDLAEGMKLQQQVDSVNRVILCTDGDFNVGMTGSALIQLVEQEREKGITLSTFGYGTGNYVDSFMEQLANKGNGNYAYMDAEEEVDRIVDKKLVATLQVIAKDTKIQIDLDPAFVQRYRLIGYENRVMKNEDFADDKKDSGELGAGHSVTAFYEIDLTAAAKAGELAATNVATVKLRWKAPDGDVSTEAAFPMPAANVAQTFEAASADFRFAAAVTEFAEILRRSKHSEGARFDDVIGILGSTANGDADRLQLASLAGKAKSLWK